MNLLRDLAQFWTAQLWPTSLQIAIFIALVYAISICCRRLPAQYRYILWLLVLVRLAVPTTIQTPVGIGQYAERFFAASIQWMSVRQSPALKSTTANKTLFEAQRGLKGAVKAALGTSEAFSIEAGRRNDAKPLLCFAWLSGILGLGLAIGIRAWQFSRRTNALQPVVRPDLVAAAGRLAVRLGITRPVRLLKAGDPGAIPFPLVRGIMRPAIILPGDMASGWTADDLEPVLLHELIHIKRNDCLVNAVQVIFQILYFYHPMVWLANWTMRRERELACDDDVVRRLAGSPADYVRSMLQAAEAAAHQRRQQLLEMAMAENFSNLGRRIRRMMHINYKAIERYRFVYLPAILALGLFCVALSAQGPQRPAADSLIFDPVITEQQVMPYAEFERIAQESAAKAGIPQSLMASILRDFREYRSNRIIRPQEWRYSMLDLLYKNKIHYELATKFLLNLAFYPVDTGFLNETDAASNSGSAGNIGLAAPPLAVGRGVKPPVTTFQPLPPYTDEARQARAEGIVVIQAVVRKDGTIGSCKILKGIGYGLDESAINTVKTQWRFNPGTNNNNEPVDVQANIEVSFRLY